MADILSYNRRSKCNCAQTILDCLRLEICKFDEDFYKLILSDLNESVTPYSALLREGGGSTYLLTI